MDTDAVMERVPDAMEMGNDLGELRRMSAWLRDACAELGLGESSAYDLEVCANEAVANVITHACGAGAAHRIRLRIAREGEAVRLDIEDDAQPYDPLSRPPVQLPASLEDARIGGLGVHLMRTLMRECRYVRRDGRNVLSLVAGPVSRSA